MPPIAIIISALQLAAKYGPDAIVAGKQLAAIILNHPDSTTLSQNERDLLQALVDATPDRALAAAEAAAGHAAPADPTPATAPAAP